MKFCIRSRCDDQHLSRVDEIKVEWRDRNRIPTLAEQFPDKDIILLLITEQTSTYPIDWAEIEEYKNLTRGHLICAAATIEECLTLSSMNIPFYLGYPIDSFYQLQALKDLGVCYVRIGPELFFDLDRVKSIGVPVRLVANVAYNDGLPRPNGICGMWVRPEDMDLYDKYITTIEFEGVETRKEQALCRIYSGDGWAGDLSDLVLNLGVNVTSRLIDKPVVKARLNCRHRCQSNPGSCHLCETAFSVAEPGKLHNYIDELKKAGKKEQS